MTPSRTTPIRDSGKERQASMNEATVSSCLAGAEELIAVVREETALVRAGKLAAARRLEGRKSELAAAYLAGISRLKSAASFTASAAEARARLRTLHAELRESLEINQMVLATAHAVAEGLVRGAAGEVTRKSAPQAYGAGGRVITPVRNAPRPVLLSRQL